MPESTNPSAKKAPTGQWDHDKVDFVLCNPVRRAILIALSDGRPRAASQLCVRAKRSLNATYKQLLKMQAKGVVLMKTDPDDDRLSAFALVPGVVVNNSPTGRLIEIGYIILRASH
jgi:hypothetical protein